MKSIKIINGPNLNMLGDRDPKVYGTVTLEKLEEYCIDKGKKSNILVSCFQSNSESNIIEEIHSCKNIDGIIINAAAYTHTSIAILDALKSVDKPTIEVHLSNIMSREDFRSQSFTAKYCSGVVMGFGYYSYILAIEAMKNLLDGEVKK